MAKNKTNKVHIGSLARITIRAGSVIVVDGKEHTVGKDVDINSYYALYVELPSETKPEPIFKFKPGDKVEIEGIQIPIKYLRF